MTKHFLAAIAFAAVIAPAAAADPFAVKVDQTVTLKLTQPANSVVIGSAAIADVTVLGSDPNTLLITGKSFGSTNLTVLDRGGHTIYSNQVLVGGQNDDQLTIVRSGGTYTYSCTDKCRSTAMVGDAPQHVQDVLNTLQAKSAAAKGGN